MHHSWCIRHNRAMFLQRRPLLTPPFSSCNLKTPSSARPPPPSTASDAAVHLHHRHWHLAGRCPPQRRCDGRKAGLFLRAATSASPLHRERNTSLYQRSPHLRENREKLVFRRSCRG